MEALRARWQTPEGAARRARILAALRTDAWRAQAAWPEIFDARPDLRGIDLRGVDLRGLDLSDTRLDHAVFDGADLRDAKLCRASLTGASLSRVRAVGLDAFAACLYGARLNDATCTRAGFVSANLAAATLHRTCLREADLRGASLFGAELAACRMQDAQLAGADVDGALIVGCRGFKKNRFERDSFDEAWGELAPLLRQYGSLMRALTPRSRLIAEACLCSCGDPAAQAEALLLSGNWRVTLAGVAAYVAMAPHVDVELLWYVLRRGSWAAPQVACAAFVLDKRFAERARAFVTPTQRWLDRLARRPPPALPPPKSRVSVQALLDRALPAGIAESSEPALARKITLDWLARSEPALKRSPFLSP
jgi:uncharacterized protein YjbI with pentapeptide repeats